MNDLQFQATRAVAEVDPHGPRGKIPTIARLRDMDGKRHTLREYIDAVNWAMNRPRYTLTRADKEWMVKRMALRLTSATTAKETLRRRPGGTATEAWMRTLRAEQRRYAALLRIAMARTVD